MAGYQEAAYAAAYECCGVWGASLAMNKPRAALKLPAAAVITLPWFNPDLSPNARVHWARKVKAAKAARQEGYYATKQAGVKVDCAKKVHLWIEFYPKTKRKVDDDNCLAAFKSYRDGIADALGMNDSLFQSHPVVMAETGGKMIVRLEQ